MGSVFWLLISLDGLIGMARFTVVAAVMSLCVMGFVLGPYACEMADSGKDAVHARWWPFTKRMFVLFLVAGCVNALLPTRQTVVEAYAYQEASKFVTGENAEKVVAETVKRIDKVVDALTNKAKE